MTDELHCIVLGAGQGTRFGDSKMLADIGGAPMIGRVVQTVKQAAIGPVHVVTGHDAEAIESAVNGICDGCLHNPLYRDGMGTSIAAGIASLPADCAAAMIVLGDQPLVSPAHLSRLASAWRKQPDRIVASSYEQTIGPPAVFPRAQFDALNALRGDEGARSLLRDPQAEVVVIECEGPMPDVDTPDDLNALKTRVLRPQ